MDRTYLERIKLRRSLMDEHPIATVQCNPVAESATIKLYQWLVETFLPHRYPTIYKPYADGQFILNTITAEPIPLHPSSATTALHTLSSHIDTDFLILLPRPSTDSTSTLPIYHLESYAVCFPSGFYLPDKLGLPLSAIHAPVPGYKSKLEKSMDRFFARLQPGQVVRRTNWTLTTSPDLFRVGGTHLYADSDAKQTNNDDDDESSSLSAQRAAVDIPSCRLRSERQILFRVPHDDSGAIVFAFRTYADTLEQVVADGDGPALVEAIDGLGEGNVPEMKYYKRGVVWGEKVCEFLRREDRERMKENREGEGGIERS